MNDTSVPDVSVVIGAYQALPYLVRCLESVAAQTLGPGRVELVVVDDEFTGALPGKLLRGPQQAPV